MHHRSGYELQVSECRGLPRTATERKYGARRRGVQLEGGSREGQAGGHPGVHIDCGVVRVEVSLQTDQVWEPTIVVNTVR